MSDFPMQFPAAVHSSFTIATLTYEKLKDYLYNQNNKKAVIVDTNFPANRAKGKLVEFDLDQSAENGRDWACSSQHVVFFATMKFITEDTCKKVCLKFKLPEKRESSSGGDPKDSMPESFMLFTQKHANYVLFNYNLAQKYLSTFSIKNGSVKLNTVYCVRIPDTEVYFWVEDMLEKFDKFWAKKEDYIDQILCTDESILSELQRHTYEESGYSHVLIDLQGQKKDNDFILCDIEFTHAQLYNHTPNMMLYRITSLNKWPQITLKSLKETVTRLDEKLEDVELKLEDVELKLEDVELKLKDVDEKLEGLKETVNSSHHLLNNLNAKLSTLFNSR